MALKKNPIQLLLHLFILMVEYFYYSFVVITIYFQMNDWQLSTWHPVQRAAPLMQSITFFFRTSNSASDGALRKNSNSVSSGIMLGSTPPLRITPDKIDNNKNYNINMYAYIYTMCEFIFTFFLRFIAIKKKYYYKY